MATERDIRNQIAYAKDKGIEQGRQEGIEQGIAQRNAEIAKAMLAKGYDPAMVQELTGLAAEEIEALK